MPLHWTLLIKEDKKFAEHKTLIEQTVIKYLKEEDLYNEMLNEVREIPEIDAEPYMTCFGISVYEQGDELVSSTNMPKHYKEMMDEIINKMDEDAPANAVAHGGVDMAPNAKKKKLSKDDEEKLKGVIMRSLKRSMSESDDNNNVVLKGVLDKLDKIEENVDKLSGIENKVEFVEEKEHKGFKSKYVKDI